MSERFSRQVVLPQVGEEGQKRLASSHVLVVGCGALGSHTAESLLRAGVGRLTLVDRDVLEVHNLHRVALMGPDDVGKPKAEACAAALRRLDRNAQIGFVVAHMGPTEAEKWIPAADLVADGLDNLETRYMVNDVCVKHGVLWTYTAVLGTHGMNMPIRPRSGPCLRCLFPEPPSAGTLPTCASAGILGPVPMALAAVQAGAAIRLLVDPPAQGRADGQSSHEGGGTGTARASEELLHVDLWGRHADCVAVPRAEDCPTCGRGEYPWLEQASRTAVLCGDAVQVLPSRPVKLDLEALAARLAPLGSVRRRGSVLAVDLPEVSLVVFPDGRALVRGTQDPGRAQSLYDQYVAR
ncbi:MAG: ThiF family adenylyltransferase [Candidatus Bipolaricaulota bacterium]